MSRTLKKKGSPKNPAPADFNPGARPFAKRDWIGGLILALTAVIIYLAAVFLFWRLLRRLDVPGAWLAAGLFALHPAMVESVAWITERKNVLSMVLFLGALLAYGRFNSFWKANDDSPRPRGWYALA